MKRFHLILAAMAAVAAVSCSKETAGPEKSGNVNLTVNVKNAVFTKATGSFDANEATVGGLQVFCFDKATGLVEDYKTGTTKQLTLSISTGTKRIYAFVNCPSLAAVQNETTLLATVTNFGNNSLSGFEMVSPTGQSAEHVIAESGTLNLSVKRIVAKVLVDKISAACTAVSMRSQDFIIEKIYLVNVAKSNNYGLTATPADYYSGSDDNGANINGMIRETGLSYNLKNSGSTTVKHGFYVYPNNSSNATKLILEAELKGVAQVYSFELPKIERNKVYDITEIKITRQSGELSETEVKVTVSDWDETLTETYTH